MESKILPQTDPLVGKALKDFRLHTQQGKFIAKIKGQGKFRSSVLTLPEKEVLVEFIPQQRWRRPNLFFRWLIALRLPYLMFSLFPLFFVLATYHQQTRAPLWNWTLLLFFSTSLLHLGSNLWSDYEDHLRGVDNPEHEGGSGVIHKLWIPAVHLRNAAAILFLLGCALGIVLLTELPFQAVSKHLLWIGLLGAFGAASFSGWPFHYKYFGLGEPIIFLLSGPLLTMAASLVYFRDTAYLPWFAATSVPFSFLAILRLHAGNMQRIPFDTMAGSTTIARLIGFNGSRLTYAFLLFAPFLTVMALWLLQITNRSSLIVFAILPLLALPLKILWEATGPLDPACRKLRKHAALLHFLFGSLYCISFLL